MDPDGKFKGDMLSVWWRPVADAQKYSVQIDQCLESNMCQTVYDTLVTNSSVTNLEETSSDSFGACTVYHLKIMAFDANDSRILKETALLMKPQNQCEQTLQVILAVTLSILSLIAVLLIASILYYSYFRRNPVHKLQRARSRIYSRLYPRDKYVRPFDKANFVADLDGKLSTMNFQVEFDELEQLAVDTIQRKLTVSTEFVNRKRNRYQDIVPFDATRVVLESPLVIEGQLDTSDYINASYISDNTMIPYGGPQQTRSPK